MSSSCIILLIMWNSFILTSHHNNESNLFKKKMIYMLFWYNLCFMIYVSLSYFTLCLRTKYVFETHQFILIHTQQSSPHSFLELEYQHQWQLLLFMELDIRIWPLLQIWMNPWLWMDPLWSLSICHLLCTLIL